MNERQELAERLAERAVAVAGLTPESGVDPFILADKLGVTVRYDAIVEDGRLTPFHDVALAQLRPDRPLARQRFTLSHELAHWLLMSEKAGTDLTRSAIAAAHDEEYLCDKIAGALLMPRAWIRAFEAEPRTLATIDRVASLANVSRSAALVRLRDELGWRTSLLHWTHHLGRWVLTGEAGLFPAQRGLIRTTEDTRWTLDRAAGRNPVSGVPVEFAGRWTELAGEVRATRRQATALCVVPYPARRRRARLTSR